MEFTVKIEAPELTKAIEKLADALNRMVSAEPKAMTDAKATSDKKAVAEVAEKPEPEKKPEPEVRPTQMYTLDAITNAGAALLDAGKMDALMGVLAKHGVQAVTQLKPEQYPTVVEDLRALGAKV